MSMIHARVFPNSVLLPDGTILVIGGSSMLDSGNPTGVVYTPELYKNGQWIEMAPHSSPRQYHSTAVLLPSGKVLVGGGDFRTWDYEVYSPPYIFCGTRPVVTSAPLPKLNYDTGYSVDFNALPQSPPTFVERVVLMRPGSVTHHSCMDQRYISLEIDRTVIHPEPVTRIAFKTPVSSKVAPRGYYMMFLVTNHGVPSVAQWVELQ